MKGCACMWIEERKGKNGDISYAYIERYTCPLSGKKKKVSVVSTTIPNKITAYS